MLNRVADLLEIKGENFFKIRAYREAVRQLDNLTTEVADMIEQGRLKEIPGIGEAIEQKIVEYVTTGRLEFLTRLETEVPPALLELTRVPGLGPRTAKDIYDALGILSLDQLEQAALAHRLLAVRGIKAKTEENILKGIAQLKRTEGRRFFPEAWLLADSFLVTLRAMEGVARAEIAGSARRSKETVSDLDLLVAAIDPASMCREFAHLPQVNEVIVQAETNRGSGARVLSGAEIDILPDGSLDLPDDLLGSLDVVVASVHTALEQPKDVITRRVLAALRSPHVDVLAHPTSRRLDRRGETQVDLDAVITEAVRTGTALEINCSPFRLDLNDGWAGKAKEAGALLAINNDA